MIKNKTEHINHNNGRFLPGHIPYNKGIKVGSRSPETEFKPGQIPHNYKGINNPSKPYGERKEIYVTISETIPAESRGVKYKTKKRITLAKWMWMQAGRDIPVGHIIYNNGDRPEHADDLKIEYLECISRAELLKRNRC